MALVQRNFILKKIINQNLNNHRLFSTNKNMIQKSVFISQSKDIYTNLALEDWLYRNFDFSNHHLLMIWQNDPCVVIGKHQNPWFEANISNLSKITDNGVKLARRNSGGGTVYHDNGNLNLTFFTSKIHYKRKYNLEIITRALFRNYGVKIQITSRDDLLLRDRKVSGTAARLMRDKAYHHCTLLVNVNKFDLSQALDSSNIAIETKATKSIKSKIINLCDENPKINIKYLIEAIGWEYLRTSSLSLKDGGLDLANKQKGFQMVYPTEKWFPGISEIKRTMESWQWRYGNTPKFTLNRIFPINDLINEPNNQLKVTMTVENGVISDIDLLVPSNLIQNDFAGNIDVITSLKGKRFSEVLLNGLDWSIRRLLNDKDKFSNDCLKKVMTSI